jgi:hypothetical protein
MHANTFHVQSSLVTLVQRRNDTRNESTPVMRQETTTTRDDEADNCNNNELHMLESNNNNNVVMTTQAVTPPPAPSKQAPKIMSLRQRINTLVMKTLADNTERDRIASHAVNHVAVGGKKKLRNLFLILFCMLVVKF